MLNRLVLVLFLANVPASAQSPPFILAPIDPEAVGGFRPTGTEVQFRKDEVWAPSVRTLYAYGGSSQLTEELNQEWTRGEWVDVRRVASVYDGRDSLVQTVRDLWEDGAWLPVERKTYGYDAEGRRSQVVAQAWADGVWADSACTSHGYGAMDNRSEVTLELWEGAWTPAYRAVSTYDAEGRETERRFQGPTAWGWEDWSRVVWSRDETGQRVEELLQNWDDTEWTSGNRTRYVHDAEGLLVEQTGEGRDYETGEWSNGNRQTRAYDEAGRLATYELALWIPEVPGDVTTEQWRGFHRWAYRYDDTGNLAEIETEGQGFYEPGWRLSTRFIYAYERATDSEAGTEPSGLAFVVAPNPSVGRAEIAFEVPRAQRVRLGVYDALGREVVVLADGLRAAGPHAVALAPGLPAGVYIVRVTGETLAGSQAITIVR